MSNRPTKVALLAAASTQRRFGLGPVDEMPVQSCGAHPMARIYSPEEVVRRMKLDEPPCFGPIDDSIKEHNMFVTEHKELMSKVGEDMKSRPHKSLRLAFIQW